MILQAILFLCSIVIEKSSGSPFGPKYPITAALFQDRFSSDLWDDALSEFAKEGGDTVWLEGPPMVRRTKSDLQEDPVFKWCSNEHIDCFEQAEEDLAQDGIKILSYASYQYEENFSDVIMRCPKYDRKVVTVNTYFRLVLPAHYGSDPCNLNGSEVVVLFTSLSGPDPHELLVQSAQKANFSVYFGLPRVPRSWGSEFDDDLMPSYYELVSRILSEQKARYSKSNHSVSNASDSRKSSPGQYDVIKGYYSSDSCYIGIVDRNYSFVGLYSNLSKIVYQFHKKKLAIAPKIDLTKFGLNRTVEDHLNGLRVLAHASVDVIAVHEGRGYGSAAYYWPTEIDLPIKLIDPLLDKILSLHSKSWKTNGTFGEAFTGSVHELFTALGNTREDLRTKEKLNFDLWFAIEAFENLDDEPCMPLPNVHQNPLELVIDRTSKKRMDQALTHGAARVQGALAFSWDPDFTCTTKSHKTSLTEEIRTDADRPIIVDCFLHSSSNRSVVVTGFNLEGETQSFYVDWPDADGHRHVAHVYGYYYELDYGLQHHYISSMEYIQMFDPYYDIGLADKGYIKIKAESSYHECVFTYDFT